MERTTGRRCEVLPVGDHEEQVGFARQLAVHPRPAVAPTGPGGQAPHLHLELERLAGDDLTAEAHVVDPPEERELAGVARVLQEGDGPHLRERLDHEDSREGGAAREVPSEEGLLPREPPDAGGPLAGLDGDDLVDKEERRPVREDRRRLEPVGHEARALRRLAGVSLGLIFGHACSILPFSSMRKAERMMPMYFLPYIDFSPHAPYFSATAWSSSDRRGNPSPYFSSNFACLAGLSGLMP